MRILKSATLTGTYDWVYPLDEAFDRDGWMADDPKFKGKDDEREVAFNAEIEAALESNDAERMRALCLPDLKPTVWKMRHLTGAARRHLIDHAMRHMNDGEVSSTSLRLAAQMALKGAENLVGNDGLPYEIKANKTNKECGAPMVSSRVMDDLETIDEGGLVTIMGSRVFGSLSASGN